PSLRLKMRFQSACLLLPLGVVLLFLSSADAPCFSGTREECKDVDFIPGHNLGGEGIDITTLARKDAYIFKMETTLNTNNTCTICKNMWMGRNEKLPLAIVDWRSIRKCKQSVTSKLYESSMSLASSSSNGVSNDWKVGLGFFPEPSTGVEVALSGSHSKVVEYAMGKAKKDKYSFSSQEVFCRYYRAGGNLACLCTVADPTGDESKDCLGVEASVTAVSVKVSSAYKQCNKVKKKKLSQQKFSDKFSEREVEVTGGDLLFGGRQSVRFKSWIQSLKTNPDIISYSLAPLHLLARSQLRKNNLKQAITDYIMERAIKHKCPRCPSGSFPSHREKCKCVCSANPYMTDSCCPKERGLGQLTVIIESAKNLWGDYPTQTDGYVKVLFQRIEQCTRDINENDNPIWNARFDFGVVNILRDNNLKVQVWDRDNGYDDDELGSFTIPVRATKKFKDVTKFLKNGRLHLKFSFTCAPNLTGPDCSHHS
uniref:C2 domain-containing protein n=1 Tax=Latimeria chalumnae TaxID=7897 RepID=H2ZTI8_LATCH